MNDDKHWFEKAVDTVVKYFSFILPDTPSTRSRIKKHFTSDYINTLNFTGLNVEPYGVLCLGYTAALFSFLAMFIMDISILLVYNLNIGDIDVFTILIMCISTILIPIVILNLVVTYPKIHAQYMKIHSLGDIPEIISYLVMYLKLVPNLENSVKFAASESSTSLASDLRKMLWDMEVRIYHGIEDALTNFSMIWGKWSEYFKRSLHLIRSSIQEREESARVITLNRALDVALDGTRDMMNQFASKLHQPTMVIYSIGIMIPLSLIAMLPAAGLIGIKITIFQVLILYDILLPVGIFLYMRKILLSRPATFNPPRIPSDHPDLMHINKKKRLVVSIIIGLIVSIPGLLFLLLPVLYRDPYSIDPLLGFIVSSDGLNSVFPVTLFFIWGIAASITSYCISVYRPYKIVRDGIKQIESEFGDALYILGKRIAEEKSPEESFVYTGKTMSTSKIAEIFNQAGYNLTALHTNIKDSLFSSEYGALKYVYSDRVKAIMRLFVEGIQKSQRAVSISLIKIADHLKELQDVEKKIKESLYSLTSTLRSTAALFAPLIAGVTLAITRLISNIITSIGEKMPSESIVDTSGSALSTVSNAFTIENIRPEYFVFVVGLYIIELVFLLTRFTNGIDEGDDKPAFMYNLGSTLPVSIIVFTLTVILGQMIFSGIVHV